MEIVKELIIYFAPDVRGANLGFLEAECGSHSIRVVRLEDLRVLTDSPAVGIVLAGEPSQIAQLENRLREAGHRIEDGGQEIRALDRGEL